MLVLPGMPPVVLRRITTIAVEGLNDSKVEFASHTGTHLDAPNHVLRGHAQHRPGAFG